MEKTKFEHDCEAHCAQCIKEGTDLCYCPGHCRDEVEFSRCGLCGRIYCSEDAEVCMHLCAVCEARIDQNVDANNEIIDINLFKN